MKTYPRRLGAILVLFGPAWLYAEEPLPSDPRIQSGKLENGVTWLFRQHDTPPGKMALMIHVRTGSLNESDAQRGLAHFIEHMCFNGSENFPPGALIPYFESIGMEFGADLNASTSFDQTIYMLFTPNTEEAQIDKALMVLSDYAFRASLLEEEINKERGIVLEEARRGKSAQQRIRDKLWPELYEGSRFASRLPIGDEKVIAEAPRGEFVDYYRAWYRPENVAVFAVGDAPAEQVVPLIEKWFGNAKAEGEPREPLKAEFKPFTRERTFVVTDPELTSSQVQMVMLRPGRPPAVTVAAWRNELIEDMASWIMARRLDQRRRQGKARYQQASVSIGDFFNEAVVATATASGEPENWKDMLSQLIEEVNRAHAYGFTKTELELARREFMANAERAVQTEPNENASRTIRRMVRAVNDREPVISAEQRLDLYKKLLPGIQTSELSAAIHEHFAPGAFAFVVTLPEKEGGTAAPSREDVASVAKAALALKPEAPVESETPTTFLAGMPEPGKVAEKSQDSDLKIAHLWLENGIRVHHRHMDYKPNEVIVTIALAGGEIEETAGNRGVSLAAALAVNEAATSRLTSTEIRDIMVGKNIRVAIPPGSNDALILHVTGLARDLETGLQLAHALLTDGRVEEEAFENWRGRLLQRIENLQRQPNFAASQAMASFIGGGDARAFFPKRSQIEALSLAEAQAWFERLCREAPIEVSVVGDVRLETVEPLLLRYLGSLPIRQRAAEKLAGLRRFERAPGPFKKRAEVTTITNKAYASAGFIGVDGRDVDDDRALQLADQVLTSRLVKRVREELGIVYSIQAQHNPSWAYEDAGRFFAGAECDPDNAGKVAEEIKKIYDDFAEYGPTDEELDFARRQVAENLDRALREPSYWSDVLEQLDLHRRSLEREKKHQEAYRKLGVEEVQSAFKKYYKPERAFQVTAIPIKPPEPAEQPSTQPAP